MIKAKKQETVESLKKIRSGKPTRAGSFWRKVPQHELLEELIRQVNEREWMGHDIRAQVSRKGKDIAIGMSVILPGYSDEIKQGISVVNSNDQSFRTAMYGGLFQNDVGIPLTKIVMGKHTHNFDLKEELGEALDTFAERAKGFSYTKKQLEDRTITYQDARQCLDDSGRKKYMPWSRVGRLLEGLTAGEEVNKWDLLYQFAAMARMNPPLRQMEQVHSFLYNILGV